MTVSPLDAAVAARSFPRRWRAALATVGDEDDAAELLARSGALDRASEAASLLAAAADRLPVQHGAVTTGGDVLERLTANATRLAAAIDAVDTETWAREDYLQTVSAAVEETAALLRRAERDLRDAVARRE